jgi:hypothetical protein
MRLAITVLVHIKPALKRILLARVEAKAHLFGCGVLFEINLLAGT